MKYGGYQTRFFLVKLNFMSFFALFATKCAVFVLLKPKIKKSGKYTLFLMPFCEYVKLTVLFRLETPFSRAYHLKTCEYISLNLIYIEDNTQFF